MKSGLLFCFLLHFTITFSQEICNNGIDDDSDGLIDLNDSECTCTVNGIPASLIPNPSFEQKDCCPHTFSQMECLTSWIRPSAASTDYMNTCGYVGSWVSQTPLVPFPDGNGAVGVFVSHNYNEYVTTCLPAPLLAGTSYTIQMHCGMTGANPTQPSQIACNLSGLPPLQWTVFGTSDCFDYAFLMYNCPMTSGMYVELGSAALVFDGQYHLLTITFTPTTNISVLTFGAPCSLPTSYPMDSDNCLAYVMVDNIILNTSDSFSLISASSSGTFCDTNLVLTATASNSGGTFQWYNNNIAIVGQTGSTLHVSDLELGAGTYQVMHNLSSGGCVSASITVPESIGSAIDANDVSICPGGSATLTATGSTNYSWSPSTGLSATTGATVTASPATTTTYTISSTENSCTSTTTSTVTVQSNPSLSVNNEAICQGENFMFGTQILTVAGTYNDTLASANGCDSIIQQLNLSVYPVPFTTLTHSMCQGESFTFGTQILTVAGTYNDTLATVHGCDSIVQLSLTVHPIPLTALTHSMCQGESFTFGNQILTVAGTYNDTLTSTFGCDSIITINLTVFEPIDTTTTTNEITITASQTNATYQWVDCKNGNAPISGETNQSYTATTNGNYAVVITKNGCSDTSACVTISTVGLNDLSDLKNSSVYPNPSTGLFHVLLDNASTITITNMFGMLVHTETVQSDGQHTIDLQSQPNGIYFMQITTWNQTQTVTLVKQQ